MASVQDELRLVESRQSLKKIIEAITSVDEETFLASSHGDDLSLLSSNTQFDSIEVSPEAVFERQDKSFEASAIVYVTLNYGGKRDHVSMPDSYPAVVEGRFDTKGHAQIESIRVDTSSFYE